MKNRTGSTRRRVGWKDHHPKPSNRFGHEGVEHQIPVLLEYCAVCFLTFGSQESRVSWGEKVAHPSCASRLPRHEAA